MSNKYLSDPNVKYEINEPIMNRIYNVLSYYANEATYWAPRIGGVVQGCPRGEVPTSDKLVWNARFMLREIERDVLKRDGTCWIAYYDGPHCDTCKCKVEQPVKKAKKKTKK